MRKVFDWTVGSILAVVSVTIVIGFLFMSADVILLESLRKYVVYSVALSPKREVFLVSAAKIFVKEKNREYILETPGKNFESLAISVSGDTMIMQTEIKNGTARLWVYDFVQRYSWELPYNGTHPAFLDEERILFDLNGKIYIVNLRDPNTQTFLIRGSRPSGIIRQNAFVYQKADATLARYTIATMEESPIALNFHAISPSVSPDGKFIAFLSGRADNCYSYCPGELWVYSFESGQARQIQNTGYQHFPAWKDNQTMVAASDHMFIFKDVQGKGHILYSFSLYDKAPPILVNVLP